MTHEPSKVQIQLALTPRQKRQIRAATGREVSTLELRLVPLPAPAAPNLIRGSAEPHPRPLSQGERGDLVGSSCGSPGQGASKLPLSPWERGRG
jgi:hypothetical protein